MGKRKTAPARTPEQRESQLISLAMDNAERMMREGNAPSQVVTHFLKLATSKNTLELEKLRADKELAEAKVVDMQMRQRTDEKYEAALNAFRIYSGEEYEDDYDE